MTATTVVLAGGLGTRVASITSGGPKALLDVGGRTFLDRKLDELAACGVDDVVLLTGHGGGAVRAHLDEHPHPSARTTIVDDGDQLLGTGGAVAAADELLPDLFWVTYGDTLLHVDMAALEAMLPHDALGLLTVVHNRDAIQPSNTSIAGGLVVGYSKQSPPGTHEHLDYGLVLLRRSAFDGFRPGSRFDLGDVLRPLIEHRRLVAAVVDAGFDDIGTPEAWRATSQRYRPG